MNKIPTGLQHQECVATLQGLCLATINCLTSHTCYFAEYKSAYPAT